tara:strand:- start:1048 stop:2028 length:981 start_codon:yes stop_codon:yes gene_type:complete
MAFKKRSKTSLSLADKVEKMSKNDSNKDEAEWKLSVDGQGNGAAVIRFLPHKLGEEYAPFIKTINHGFNVGNRWFIENCPTTHGEQCPVCTSNSELWATETTANKAIASTRKRKISYWANILVLKDSTNPDCENKVFKYRFGVKILEKITAASRGNAELDEPEIDVTCVYDGANFSLKAKTENKQRSYDESKFGISAPLYKGDETKLEEVFNALHDIDTINDAKNFKDYATLEKEFNTFLGASGKKSIKPASEELPSDDEMDDDEMDDLLNSSNESDEIEVDDDEIKVDDEPKNQKKSSAAKKQAPKPSDDEMDDLDDLDALLSEL